MKAQGPKSMVSPDTAMLSVFITPWMKPNVHPARDELRLPPDDRAQQLEIRAARRTSDSG